VRNSRHTAIGLTVAVPLAFLVATTFDITAADETSTGKDRPGEPLIRDPFWPVGYWPKSKVDPTNVVAVTTSVVTQADTPAVAQQPPPPPEDPPKWPDVRPRGIMKMPDGHFEAVIEGIKGVVKAGQTVTRVEGKYEYSWRIDSISGTGVRYTRVNFKKIK
jgi:hypothetical protein